MLRGVFVTGTDTNVGKTVVSAAVMHRYRAVAGLRYWKPVQTGIEQDDDTREVARLAGLEDARVRLDGVRLPRPLSPHLSAALAGTRIEVRTLIDLAWQEAPDTRWVIEGAGGVLVPLNERELMVDLISLLGVPALIAARSTLGTINHTLLTIEALRARAVPIAGVVLVGPPNADNRVAIETMGSVSVVGELPLLDPLTPQGLRAEAEGLDPLGMLDPYLA